MCVTSQTVALEELNSEYVSLKRRLSSRDEADALISLKSRYGDLKLKVNEQPVNDLLCLHWARHLTLHYNSFVV